jgi:chromosomal replication initiator protein
LGKTHLLHAIAHEAAGSGKHVVLLTCKEFAERYAKTVRDGHRHEFLDTYRHIDVLLLDDLQFLTTRPGSQEQFFHIFNALYSNDRLLVITSDTPPQALDGLSPHLSSRLQAGLTVTVQLPPQEERLEILRAKAADLKHAPPEPILWLIARQRCQHIRELEGALNRVVAYADLTEESYTVELAKLALRPLHEPPSRPSPDTILKIVCKHFHLSLSQITGPSRARDVTYARHIAMYLLRYSSQRPLAEIGELIGGRDHSTVFNGCRRIKRELTSLPQTHTDLQQLEAAL